MSTKARERSAPEHVGRGLLGPRFCGFFGQRKHLEGDRSGAHELRRGARELVAIRAKLGGLRALPRVRPAGSVRFGALGRTGGAPSGVARGSELQKHGEHERHRSLVANLATPLHASEGARRFERRRSTGLRADPTEAALPSPVGFRTGDRGKNGRHFRLLAMARLSHCTVSWPTELMLPSWNVRSLGIVLQ